MIQHRSHTLGECFSASCRKTKTTTIYYLSQPPNVRSNHQSAAHHLLNRGETRCFLPNRRHQNCSHIFHCLLKGSPGNESRELNIFCKTQPFGQLHELG